MRTKRTVREPLGWLRLEGVTRNNLRDLRCEFPLGVMTTVTGISGSGKSSLVGQALVDLVGDALGKVPRADPIDADAQEDVVSPMEGTIVHGMEKIRRLVEVDQRAIGRTPRSNLATYTGLFDHIRSLFASTPLAKRRRYDAGRFSFNVAKGRCPRCDGEGFVMVELLFLPSVYTPCPVCHGSRFNEKTLEVEYRSKTIAQVLDMTVDAAADFFTETLGVRRPLEVLKEVGLGYLRLGQPATELSGGEAQRVKLATELQRGGRGGTLYVLDEPTTGLHPSDVERLLTHVHALVDAGNTAIIVDHDMSVAAASDWVVDLGPGAGDEGGRIVANGTPAQVAMSETGRTAAFLRKYL